MRSPNVERNESSVLHFLKFFDRCMFTCIYLRQSYNHELKERHPEKKMQLSSVFDTCADRE